MGTTPGAASSTPKSFVAFTLSLATPLMPGSLVMPSEDDKPVSWVRPATSVGATRSLVNASRMMLRPCWLLLPAVSVNWMLNVLAPSARLTPAKLKRPLASVWAVRFRPSSVTWVAGSLWPTKVTTPVVVIRSPSVPLSDAGARSNAIMTGALVSSTKPRSKKEDGLPAASLAISRNECAPSASVPPARTAICAAGSVKLPFACRKLLRSTLGATPGAASSTPKSWVALTLSLAVPLTLGLLVSPSLEEAPVSLDSAATKVGATVSVGLRVMLMLACLVLPAASVDSRLNGFAPSPRFNPAKLNKPLASACVFRFNPTSLSLAAASVRPASVTTLAVVIWSPRVPVSDAGSRSNAMTAGARVSSVKLRSTGADLLPAASLATRRSVCAPSASVPPANAASCAAETVKRPPACRLLLKFAVGATPAPASSAPSRAVTPWASVAVPATDGSIVSPSALLAPVSLARRAASSGAVESRGWVLNWGTLAGLTICPLMVALVGNAGATMRLLASSAPPMYSSCMRLVVVPTSTSSPSLNMPLTGLTPTMTRLSTMPPTTRKRASVPAPNTSAALPLPPSAASLPKSAPTNSVKFLALPLVCTS